MWRSAMADLKSPTTYQEQLNILKSRGVTSVDDALCIEVLENIGYYRFVAYFLPFKNADGSCKTGTDFMRVYRIYEFDRVLRRVLFSALEEVEVFFRARVAYHHAHKYGAEGYMTPENFSEKHRAEKFIENVNREITNNKNSAFVTHHIQNYDGHFPLWVIMELFSFGMLSRFYGDMKTPDQKAISKGIYNTVPQNIRSWLRCCTDLRNICAHYGRLYYRKFPATPANVDASDDGKSKLWGAVLALKALYPSAEKWNNAIVPQIAALIEEYAGDISPEHIGFPPDWETKILK